jgi:NADH:ubiquinone reductase (H+-translocating)
MTDRATSTGPATRVAVIGGGVVGLEVARRLNRATDPFEVTVIDPHGIHVYQPLLPEVASGVMEPRHAVVPLRAALPDASVVNGEASRLAFDDRVLRVRRGDGTDIDVPFDHLVVAPGSITRVMPVPGLADHAVGFQTVAEALHLRDRVLEHMQLAEGSRSPEFRARALTFVFVGAGYSGIEAAGELNDLAVEACAQFRGIAPDDLRFVIVEATDQILPMVGERLRRSALADLERRGIEVRLDTVVEAVEPHAVHLSDGTSVASDTLVWCAGARPHPVVDALGLPLTDDGFVQVDSTLAVVDDDRSRWHGVWSGGDCAAVPDLIGGGQAPGSAQYALREGATIAANIERAARGRPSVEFRYRQRGEMITLGRYSAVGEILGVPVRGVLAWLLRAAYHVARFPTFSRKARVGLDWAIGLAFPREITSLGSARHPRGPIEAAAEEA